MKVTDPIDVYIADKLFQLTSQHRAPRRGATSSTARRSRARSLVVLRRQLRDRCRHRRPRTRVRRHRCSRSAAREPGRTSTAVRTSRRQRVPCSPRPTTSTTSSTPRECFRGARCARPRKRRSTPPPRSTTWPRSSSPRSSCPTSRHSRGSLLLLHVELLHPGTQRLQPVLLGQGRGRQPHPGPRRRVGRHRGQGQLHQPRADRDPDAHARPSATNRPAPCSPRRRSRGRRWQPCCRARPGTSWTSGERTRWRLPGSIRDLRLLSDTLRVRLKRRTRASLRGDRSSDQGFASSAQCSSRRVGLGRAARDHVPRSGRTGRCGPDLEEQDLAEGEPELLDVGDVGLHQSSPSRLVEVEHEHVDVEGVEVEAVPGMTLSSELGRGMPSGCAAGCRRRAAARSHSTPRCPDHRGRSEQAPLQVEVSQLGEVTQDEGVGREHDGRPTPAGGDLSESRSTSRGGRLPTATTRRSCPRPAGAHDGDGRPGRRRASGVDVDVDQVAGDHPGPARRRLQCCERSSASRTLSAVRCRPPGACTTSCTASASTGTAEACSRRRATSAARPLRGRHRAGALARRRPRRPRRPRR